MVTDEMRNVLIDYLERELANADAKEREALLRKAEEIIKDISPPFTAGIDQENEKGRQRLVNLPT